MMRPQRGSSRKHDPNCQDSAFQGNSFDTASDLAFLVSRATAHYRDEPSSRSCRAQTDRRQILAVRFAVPPGSRCSMLLPGGKAIVIRDGAHVAWGTPGKRIGREQPDHLRRALKKPLGE